MEKKLGQELAFPADPATQSYAGVSKRFYAACAAMQGILASGMKISGSNPNPSLVARTAYLMADELLKKENL